MKFRTGWKVFSLISVMLATSPLHAHPGLAAGFHIHSDQWLPALLLIVLLVFAMRTIARTYSARKDN